MELDEEEKDNSEVPQNILAELHAEFGNMTENEQAVLANYLSNAELTDGFEFGFQKLGMNNNGGKLGQAAWQRRQDRESDNFLQSDGDSLQLSGAENDIISNLKLRNKRKASLNQFISVFVLSYNAIFVV